MARINFDTFNSEMQRQETTGGGSGDGIGYFGLKNDGDEGIVRILHDSSDDFDIVIAHNVQVGERYRKFHFLCNPTDHPSVCPLWSSDNKAQYRFFVHMIQYVQDERGQIVAKPVVWERSAKQISQKLNSMIQEYGPLSQSIFKIRRNGAAGSKDTTYEIMFANPNIFKPELYPMVPDAFKNYNTLGYKVLDKNAEEMRAFLATGNFPSPNNNAAPAATQAPAYTAPPVTPAPNVQTAPAPQPSANYGAPAGYSNAPTGYSTPPAVGGYAANDPNTATARPNRYY